MQIKITTAKANAFCDAFEKVLSAAGFGTGEMSFACEWQFSRC